MTHSKPNAPQGQSEADQRLRGLGLMAVAMQIAPMIDALAKIAMQRLPSIEVVSGRFLVQMLLCLILAVARRDLASLRVPNLRLQILRGLMLVMTSLLFISSLKWMPLVDAFAIAFIEPMLLTGLSAMVLKERVGPRRWAACLVGFCGCLIVIRPNYAIFGWQALLPVGSALSFALYHMLTRQLAGQGSLLGTQFMTGLIGSVVACAALGLAHFMQISGQQALVPNGFELLLILGVGLCSLASHALILRAFQYAPAMVLAPLGYLEIIGGTLFGYFIFGDFPHPLTWLGIAIIIASGLYILHREHRRAG